jgi:hypothetical protein
MAQPLWRSLHDRVDGGGKFVVHTVALSRGPSELQSRFARASAGECYAAAPPRLRPA